MGRNPFSRALIKMDSLHAVTNPLPRRPDTPIPATMEELTAAFALLKISESKTCCLDRPDFVEPCPMCGSRGTFITHASKGMRTCNGCEDKFCTKCLYGSRYCCAYVYGSLDAPAGAERQLTLGVQSPKAEEKKENK